MSFFLIFSGVNAQNPFVKSIYTADPSTHVWEDGRLYVYPSHDIAPPRGCDLMDQYHVFSTDDMVNWTDHGEILSSDQVDWGRPEGGFMWAPDCAYKDGIYYFYFPHPSKTEWNNSWKIGVATSSEPAANFTVQGYIEGLKSMIDPCVFVDDDGQAYLFYGGGGHCEGGRLKDNMLEIDGKMQEMSGLVDFHEATWVHKKDDVYYLSYSDNHSPGGNQMRYATSDHPLGPWTYQGVYIEQTGSSTNHGSIVEYKGQWYAFYHNSILSGNDWLRSICVDSLFYNEDGTIQQVVQTRAHGTPYDESPIPIPGIIEVEDYDIGGQGVAYSDNDITNSGGSFRGDEGVDVEMNSPGNYNVGFTNGGEWMEYTVNIQETGSYALTTVVASPDGNCSIHIKLDGINVSGTVSIPSTGGWQNYKAIVKENVKLEQGIHIIQLFEETGGFNIDKIIFTADSPVSSKLVEDVEPNFYVYPNPASSFLNVEYLSILKTPVKIEIYNFQGISVYSTKQTASSGNNHFLINLNELKAGNYLVKLNTNSGAYIEKLVIK